MKKLIFGILFSLTLLYGSVHSVSASTVTHVTSYGDSPYIYVYDDGATYYFNNINFGNGTAYHPVAFFDGTIYHFMGKYTRVTIGGNNQSLNSVYYNGSDGNTINNRSASSVQTTFRSITFDGLPCFNNLTDALNYAKNLSYNPNNIVSGSLPASYDFSTNINYQPKITDAKFAYLYKTELDNIIWNPILDFVPLWANFSTRFSTQINVTCAQLPQIPDYNKSTLFVFVDLPSVSDVQSFMSTYAFNLNSPLFKSQIDAFMESNNSYRWINDYTYTGYKFSGEFTRDTLSFDFNAMLDGSAQFQQLVTLYGSENAAYVAWSLLGRIQSISLVDFGFNSSTNKYVAYPAGQWYFDKLFYDGSLYQKRQISVNVPPSTGVSAPTYQNPGDPSGYGTTGSVIDDEIQKNYTDLVNQSNGNNQFNIYVDNVNDRLDDWWNDGDLDINENIGNLYSLLKSVTNIGLLFGLIFNGFFPPYVLSIMGFALLLIPIVLIIKLIRG